jgi:hypothetical protein
MPDQLEEIKDTVYASIDSDDIDWLISEVDRLREENEQLKRFENGVLKLFEDVKRERVGNQ